MRRKNACRTWTIVHREDAMAFDLRDGTSDVQRRLLQAIERKVGATGKRTKVRSDIVLKEVLGGPVPPLEASLVAPSGDAAAEPYLTTYLELARMAQPFRTRYPLVAWEGIVGTMDGGPPA